MPFTTSYIAGGLLEQIKLVNEITKLLEVTTIKNIEMLQGGTIDTIKRIEQMPTLDINFPSNIDVNFPANLDINFPAHIIPQYTQPYTKGLKLDIPSVVGVYNLNYTATSNLEFIDVAIACSGYNADDYWNLYVNDVILFDTIYTKEIPQHVNMGTTLFAVYRVKTGDIIRLEFHNVGAESKTAWVDFRFLKQV